MISTPALIYNYRDLRTQLANLQSIRKISSTRDSASNTSWSRFKAALYVNYSQRHLLAQPNLLGGSEQALMRTSLLESACRNIILTYLFMHVSIFLVLASPIYLICVIGTTKTTALGLTIDEISAFVMMTFSFSVVNGVLFARSKIHQSMSTPSSIRSPLFALFRNGKQAWNGPYAGRSYNIQGACRNSNANYFSRLDRFKVLIGTQFYISLIEIIFSRLSGDLGYFFLYWFPESGGFK